MMHNPEQGREKRRRKAKENFSMRRLSAVVWGLMGLGLLAGCGSHNQGTVSAGPAVGLIPPAPAPAPAEMVVAADGSGEFTSVQAAIDAIVAGKGVAVIHIRPGVYVEHITIDADKPAIRMYGDDAVSTVLTFNMTHNTIGKNGLPVGTAKSASTTVMSNDFEADNLTFANSTPRDVSQALAIAAEGDRGIFRKCRFLGWQDTLFTNGGAPPLTAGDTRPSNARVTTMPATTQSPTAAWSNRIYFENCYIEGGVDFIFGSSTAVFMNCEIRSKRSGYVTAASTLKSAEYGYVFMNCRLTANTDVKAGSVYLGRPWRDYAAVIYLNCWMGGQINPGGWSPWKSAPQRIHTVRYAEYNSTGEGAGAGTRVEWSRQLTAEEAGGITVSDVLGGWDPMVGGE
jgi:pectinesterase